MTQNINYHEVISFHTKAEVGDISYRVASSQMAEQERRNDTYLLTVM